MGLFVRNLVDVLKTEGEAFVANVINSFSCRYNHDVDRYLKEDAILFNVSAYLIAQLGKNYNAADGKLITGGQILDLAKDELRVAKRQVGGQVVFIEKEQGNASLDAFYRKNGFVPFDKRVSEEDGVTYDLMFSFLK